MSNNLFIGTGVAMITPFTRENEVDYPALKKIIRHLVDGRVEYIVIMGTTAESVTLTKAEKEKIIDFVKQETAGRIDLVLGIGGNNTAEVLDTIKKTDFKDIEGILSVSPYYNKPTQTGIYYHYKAIAEASPVPVILYNVPGRTSSNIAPETTLKLAHEFKNIVAIKEASGSIEQCMQIIRNKPEGFKVISGDDNLTLPYLSVGMVGVISVVANALPYEYSEMVRSAMRGDYANARNLHYNLLDVMQAIFAEGNPGGIKALMNIKGLCENDLRLPLYRVSDSLYERLQKLAK